ncbi:MAG: RluA family pseudouridine synthase [Rhodospirillales bacterium]|nr:RluA family pseudouridine synthase [Rhodospirillales bacterium]
MSGVAQRAVAEDEADIRLDRWFRRHFPDLTQGVIQRLCRTGQIRVDGRRADAATRLAPGQSVRIPPLPAAAAPPPDVPPPDARNRAELERMLLYRDDHLIVLDKPPGLPTQGGPGIARHLDGMLAALATAAGDRPRLVHRLDRDTSGVLVVARSPGVAAKLAAAFRTRAVEKTYWAVVVGRPVPVAGRIDVPLVRHDPGIGGARVAPATDADRDAARAITEYRTLDHAGRRLAWLELSPLTGRTHQLRVHCAAIGAPILGDAAYGVAPLEGLSPLLHLHARRLVLPHPAGGTLAVEAGLPPHMAATFRALGFTAPAAHPPQRK